MARLVVSFARLLSLGCALLAVSPLTAGPISAEQEQFAEQRIQYDDDAPKTILELQQFRTTSRIKLQRANGTPGIATLTNLNPQTNTWYLLSLDWSGRYPRTTYHLENPDRTGEELREYLRRWVGAAVRPSAESTIRQP